MLFDEKFVESYVQAARKKKLRFFFNAKKNICNAYDIFVKT